MKEVIRLIIIACFCLFILGCTTLKESRGYLNEDIGNLIYDLKSTAFSLQKADAWIREHLW